MDTARILWWLDLIMLIAGGIIALGTLAVWWQRGRNPLRGAPLRPNRIGILPVWVCVTAYFVGATAGGAFGTHLARDLSDDQKKTCSETLGANGGAAFAILACLLVSQQAFRGGWRGLGLSRRPFSRDLLAAVPVWLAALAVCSAAAWSTLELVKLFNPQFKVPLHGVFTTLKDPAMPAAMKVLAFLGALLLAPLAEELLFRGILQTGVKRLLPASRSLLHRWGAIVAVGLLFGAMHSTTPHHVPALALFGVILGYAYERTGSLTLPMLVHFLFNGKSLLWDLLLPRA